MIRPGSQNARILELLSDGGWYTTREILQAVPCIVHSRISELERKHGYLIEHEGTGGGAGNHRYRLVLGGQAEVGGLTAPVGDPSGAACPPNTDDPYEQLTFGVAA